MSNRNRLGLTDLAGLRKPLVQTAASDIGQEVSSSVQPAVRTAVPPDAAPYRHSDVPLTVPPAVPADAPPRILQDRKIKQRLISQSFKLPVDLDERWSNIASFNKVTKTGILLEALETFLQRLPQPPDSKSKG